MAPGAYRALLIGNSTYPGDRHNLPDLEGPRNDPVLLREALCDSRYGLFAPDQVRLVREGTTSQVLLAMEDFFSEAAAKDTLLLYYSGHGQLDLRNDLYLCAHDTVSDRLLATAVSAAHVNRIIEGSAAHATVVLLDCCHAGGFKGGDISSHLAGTGRFVVASCRKGELARDTDVRDQTSLFTHHLIEGLVGGAPDHDADGNVDLSELYHYVREELIRTSGQRPHRNFSGEDVPIARRPTPPDTDLHPGPAPPWTGAVPPRPVPPPPPPTRPPPVEAAGLGARFGAAMIDGALLALLLAPGAIAISVGPKEREPCRDDPSRLCDVPTDVTSGIGLALMAIGAIAWCVYKVVTDSAPRGQSLGKRATGLRVVDIRTGLPLDRARAAGRTIAAFAIALCGCGVLLVVDLLFPRWDAQRQTLHDKVVGSVVITDRPPPSSMPGAR